MVMLERQRILLALIWTLREQNKRVTKTLLDKLLFILGKESAIREFVKFYNFYPYKYGPFSSNFYRDLNDLKSRGYIDENYLLNKDALQAVKSISNAELEMIGKVAERFDSKTVVDYIYKTYPAYAANNALKNAQRGNMQQGIFSIGYEKKDIDLFLDILVQNNIDLVIDVRANAFSMNRQFIKNKLVNSLSNALIGYIHIPELGIASDYRKSLKTDGDYKRLFELYRKNMLPEHMDKVKMLSDLVENKRFALMCFEENENHCHRKVLSDTLEKAVCKNVIHL